MNKELIKQLELLRGYKEKGCLDLSYKLLIDYIDELENNNNQLNNKINKIRELVENSDWRLDDVHDLIDGYDEIAKIII